MMMASKSTRTSPDKQRRIDGSSCRPSSEQQGVKVKGTNNVNTDLRGSVKSLAREVGAKLAIGNSIEPSVNGVKSLGVCIEHEKKAAENGVSPHSGKVSDGTGSFPKTSGSAKTSDCMDFAESGKSSVCRGSTCSDVSDENSCSSLSSSNVVLTSHIKPTITNGFRLFVLEMESWD